MPRPPRPRTIAPLDPTETMTFDHGKLARVCDDHGHRAEAYIAFVLTEVETLLDTARHQAPDATGGAGLARTCTDLVRLAGAIGMVTVERVAQSVLDCIAARDPAALAACHRRLVRLGETADSTTWTMDRAAHPDGAA